MSTRTIITLHLRKIEPFVETITLLGNQITLHHEGCDSDLAVMAAKIAEWDGRVDAIALSGVAKTLRLGKERVEHAAAGQLFEVAQQTPVVDGSGVRDAMERWAVRLAADAQPGIWARKRVLMAPGLNHTGLAQALNQYTDELRYADPLFYFNLPATALIGSAGTLNTVAGPTMGQMRDLPYRLLFPPPGAPGQPRDPNYFHWADVIAGDIHAIRRYAPAQLKHKTVVVEYADADAVADLTDRGVSLLVTTMPPLAEGLSHLSAVAFEACLVALRPAGASLTENTYLNLMADLDWQPGIRYLQKEEAEINRFAFVIHPLSLKFIHKSPQFRWTRYLPDRLVERMAAELPPMYLSRITGIESPTTGQKVEGVLITLGATPKEFLRRDPAFAYRRLIAASRIAERLGARIMGLGAFTSVVGDAGISVAQKADIAITSGNSLTVAATLETAKQAVVKMGNSLDQARDGRVMVIGATGSIGAVCSRLLAQAAPHITLVAPRPEKLIALKRTIETETPDAQVTISTSPDDFIGACDLIITTTTAVGKRILDITKCKPGAVICDIARPPDVTEEENALRPDVLVIESGEILLPGKPNFGYDIGLPPGVAYACLAETALLALEGRFEDYTLGREIEIERVKEMYHLYKKHGLQLSGLRSHGEFLSDEEIAHKRALADELRQDAAVAAHWKQEAAGKGHAHEPGASPTANGSRWSKIVPFGLAALGAVWLLGRRSSGRDEGEGGA